MFSPDTEIEQLRKEVDEAHAQDARGLTVYLNVRADLARFLLEKYAEYQREDTFAKKQERRLERLEEEVEDLRMENKGLECEIRDLEKENDRLVEQVQSEDLRPDF